MWQKNFKKKQVKDHKILDVTVFLFLVIRYVVFNLCI